MTQNNQGSFLNVIMRGVSGRCPNCGQGRLFKSYLKQVETCAACNEELGSIRTDDGPAWLTIILVGHILAPFLLFVLPKVTWPDWEIMAVIMTLMLLLVFTILPRAKGAFIGMIWRSDCIGGKNKE